MVVVIERACRGCGCTNEDACWPPCFWVDQFWCSACEHKLGRRLTASAAVLALAAAVLAFVAGVVATAENFQSALVVGFFSALAVVAALVLGHVGARMLEVSST